MRGLEPPAFALRMRCATVAPHRHDYLSRRAPAAFRRVPSPDRRAGAVSFFKVHDAKERRDQGPVTQTQRHLRAGHSPSEFTSGAVL